MALTRGRKVVASQGANRERATKQQSHRVTTHVEPVPKLSFEEQQRVLDVFIEAFCREDQSRDLKPVIQEVKAHLFNRDFHAAFGKLEYLEAYAIRWSAARALAYADLFMRRDRYAWLKALAPPSRTQEASLMSASDSKDRPATDPTSSHPTAPGCEQPHGVKIVCIGGGAGAEIVALAGTTALGFPFHSVDILAVDIADWRLPIEQLYKALTTPPILSGHASKAVKDSNKPLVDPTTFRVTFLHRNVLDTNAQPSKSMIDAEQPQDNDQGKGSIPLQNADQTTSPANSIDFGTVDLVTVMFTLNELFAASLSKTTSLLLHLSDTMRKHSHLVVLDSPGSYSEIKLGQSSQPKRYPMKWLLDHTLLEVAGEDKWTKIEDNDSIWFRLDNKGKNLKYPVELENCRYQIHVYRKL